MADIAEIRAALADQVATALDVTGYDVMPANPDTPCVAVLPRSWEYGETFDGAATWLIELWAYVNPSVLDEAQRQIDVFLAPSGSFSIVAAIEADPSLGIGVYATAKGAGDYARLVDYAGGKVLGGYVLIEVLA